MSIFLKALTGLGAGGLSSAGGLGGLMKNALDTSVQQSPLLKAMNAMNGAGGNMFENGQMQPVIETASLGEQQPYVDPQVSAQPAAPALPAPTTVAKPAEVKSASAADWTPFITQTAQKYGIDPATALRVVKSEGGTKGWIQSNARNKKGIREPSYGPLQMLVGGPGTGFPEGMGNQFMRETGLDPRDPKNAEAAIDFALGQAAKLGWGQWYGAAKVGVGKFDGIGGKRSDAPVTAKGPQIDPQQPAGSRVLASLGVMPEIAGSAPEASPEAESKPQTPMERLVASLGNSQPVQAPQMDALEQVQAVDLGEEEIAMIQQNQSEARRQNSSSDRASARREALRAATRHQKPRSA